MITHPRVIYNNLLIFLSTHSLTYLLINYTSYFLVVLYRKDHLITLLPYICIHLLGINKFRIFKILI